MRPPVGARRRVTTVAIFRVPVRIDYPGTGGPGFNVFAVRTIGPSGDDADQLEDAMDALTTFYTALAGRYQTGTIITLGEGIIKDPLGSPEYQNASVRTVNGTGQAGMGPALLAVVVSWRTTSATRSGRGRTFIGPLQTGQVETANGLPSASLINGIRNAADDLVDASTGPSGWSLGVLSTKQGLLRDWTSASVQQRWSFLSSRRD